MPAKEQLCAEGVPGALPPVTKNKNILSKPTIRRAQPMLVSGRLGRLLLLLVAIKFMHSPMKDHQITTTINWQLLTMFFFNNKDPTILQVQTIDDHF